MNEIVPGVLHWTALHPNIRIDVSSYLVTSSGTLIDPLLPDDDVSHLGDHRIERIILTNRHHSRSSEAIAREHGCPILCHEAGLHRFADEPYDIEGFSWGDELAPGITALEVDAICPEETALRIDLDGGLLSIADAVMRYEEDLHFVPERYLVDDPKDAPAVKVAIREAFGRLLDEPFDSLLFAHGNPLIGGGKEALRDFVEHGPAE